MTDEPSNPNNQVQVYTLGDMHDRLQTIIDEHFGVRPTTPVDELLDILERELNARRVMRRAVAEDSLEEKLLDEVRCWLARATPPLIDGTHNHAQLKIRIGDAATDDDGSPYLSFGVSEKLVGPHFTPDCGGRVPSVALATDEDG